MTTRVENWQQALSAVIRACWNAPFAWGEHDCVMFAADCVQAITGSDPAAEYRGKYETEVGAAKLMKRSGGLREMATAALGDEISPALATLGDVGLHEVDEAPALAICAGTHWLAAGPNGLVALQHDSIVTSWRCA